MKRFFKTAGMLVSLFAAVVTLNSCSSSDEDKGPTNVITDGDGIKIDLEWTTGGTTNDALNEADLDLRIYKGGSQVLSSESSGSFERIEFDPDLYADGTYTVAIVLFENDEDTNYTATVNGISVTDPFTFTSTFAATEDYREINAFTITKLGSKYTMEPID